MKIHSLLLTFIILSEIANATIEIAIKSPECVVFAADGRVTTDSGTIVSDSYEKIVLVNNYVMVQASGAAAPGLKNLKTTIQDFTWHYNIGDTSHIYCDSVLQLFRNYCKQERELGVNYSEYKLRFAGPDKNGDLKFYNYVPFEDDIEEFKDYRIYYFGSESNVFRRLIEGIENMMYWEIKKYLYSFDSCISRKNVDSAFDVIKEKYNLNNISKPFNWSEDDAIEFAYALIKTTVTIGRMVAGKFGIDHAVFNPGAGGKIVICIATRRGARFVEYVDR